MHTTFNLKTALEQKFFNLSKKYIGLVGHHEDPERSEMFNG